MSYLMQNKDFIKVDKNKAQEIPTDGLYYIMKNRYWAMLDGNIFFYKSYTSPQCNMHKEVMIRSPLVVKHGASIEFIETVFVPHSCSDYI